MNYGVYQYKEILDNYDIVVVVDGVKPNLNERVELYDDMQEIAFVKVLN